MPFPFFGTTELLKSALALAEPAPAGGEHGAPKQQQNQQQHGKQEPGKSGPTP